MFSSLDTTVNKTDQGGRAQRLFAAVVLAALDDAIADDKKYGNGAEQIARWARSRDGREVLMCAGIDPNERCVKGMIEFVNPNQEGRELAKLLPKSGFDNMIRIRPKTGQIVIFPSYVLHSVYPNSSNQDRITIAFNSLLLKKKKS